MRIGASYHFAGTLSDRWSLDYHAGTLRVLLANSAWGSSARLASLRTFAARRADDLEPLAILPLETAQEQRLTAVRFDGPRAFAATSDPAARRDPLWGDREPEWRRRDEGSQRY